MKRFHLLHRLRLERSGSTIIEFALLAPVFLITIFGIVQTGMAMQEYNALRGVTSDVARYAMVQRQKGLAITTTSLESYGTTVARSDLYRLPATGLQITVTEPATRVTDTTEYSITVRARVNNIMPIASFSNYFMSYTRPIFVPD
jgi:Flp pilus assembly protein TadG